MGQPSKASLRIRRYTGRRSAQMKPSNSSTHDHQHSPNRFAVVPTHIRLDADPNYSGKGVTIAFLDSGFYPHPDLLEPESRILAYRDLAEERPSLSADDPVESWQW